LHRDEAGFAQRMVFTIAADGHRLDAQGTMSRNGGRWEDDLRLTYERINSWHAAPKRARPAP
jgi:hypothetical protein